jgi:hypothetical protein
MGSADLPSEKPSSPATAATGAIASLATLQLGMKDAYVLVARMLVVCLGELRNRTLVHMHAPHARFGCKV